MKKFNKKSMLGFMTASAIVVTTVGSFAVWDQLSATKTSAEITFTKPVETVMEDITLTQVANDPSTYTGTVKVTSTNLPAEGDYKVMLESELVSAIEGVTTAIGVDASATDASYTDLDYTAEGGTYTVVVKANRADALKWDTNKSVAATVTATVSAESSGN